MKKLYILLASALLLLTNLQAQVVIGDSTSTSESAVVELKKGGLLIPRITTNQRKAMSTGAVLANSLMVYDTDEHRFYFYNTKTYDWVVMNPWETTLKPNSNLLLGNYGNVGIGTQYPKAKLAVAGNVAIGPNYAKEEAPENGLIIEGKLGIGTTNPQATVDVNGTLKTDNLEVGNLGVAPWMTKGMITMWTGKESDIPDGWEVCDGGFSAGAGSFKKPDLRGRSPIGAGDDYSVNDVYGNAEVTLTKKQIPTHNHYLQHGSLSGQIPTDGSNISFTYAAPASTGSLPSFGLPTSPHRKSSNTNITTGSGTYMNGSTSSTKPSHSGSRSCEINDIGQAVDLRPREYTVVVFIIKVK